MAPENENKVICSETEMAMEETKAILSGKKSTKLYASAKELFDELDAEEDDI